jgi:hypothetical protein
MKIQYLIVSLDAEDNSYVHFCTQRLVASLINLNENAGINVIHNSTKPLFRLSRQNLNEYAIPRGKLNPLLSFSYGRNFRVRCLREFDPADADFVVLLDADILCLNRLNIPDFSEAHILSAVDSVSTESLFTPRVAVIPGKIFTEVVSDWWYKLLEFDDQGQARPDIFAWNSVMEERSGSALPREVYGPSSVFEASRSQFLHYSGPINTRWERFSEQASWMQKSDFLAGIFVARFYPQFCNEFEKTHRS